MSGSTIGLLAGGVLTEAINWHWIFFVNLPIGIVTAVLAVRFIENADGLGIERGADIPGALLLIAGLMIGVYNILEVAEVGWGATQTIALGAVSLGLVGAFLFRQARIGNPLMPLRLFRSRNVSGANGVQVLLVVGLFGLFFLGALYMQGILGYDPLEVGLAYLPASVVMGAMSFRFTAKLSMRFGMKRTMLPGMVLIGVAMVLFSRTPVDANYFADILPSMLVFGLGSGLAFPLLMQLAMAGVEPQDSGLASGLVNTSAQVGGAIGLAVLATLASDRTDSLAAAGKGAAEALNGGYHLAYVVGAVLVGIAVVVAAIVFKEGPVEDAEVAEEAMGAVGPEPLASEA